MKFSLYILLILVLFNQKLYAQNNPVLPVGGKIANVEVVEVIDGLFFTVQLGAFTKPIEADEIFNVSPLVIKYADGLYKYSTGIYRTVPEAVVRKDKMIAKGVEGAFVTAYYKGERSTIVNANELISEYGEDIFAISESGDVKRIDGSTTTTSVFEEEEEVKLITVDPTNKGTEYYIDLGTYSDSVPRKVANAIFLMQDYKVEMIKLNNGSQYMSGVFLKKSDAELARDKFDLVGISHAKLIEYYNGVKVTNSTPKPVEGLIYRVFLGTYSNGVPQARSMIFLELDHLGIESIQDADGATYYCGSESLYKDAREVLRNFTNQGISIARIVAFKNGEEIDVNLARNLTNE